jgi:nucleotide-binding universal stress UspA family protein
MTTFKRILAPVDLTDNSREAVNLACRLASGNNGQVILLHVIETIEHLEMDELQAFYRRLEKNATARLAHLAERAKQRGVSIQKKILFGKRARTIIDFAAKRRVDLIVLNSHRVKPDSGFPSISYDVGVLAECAVLLLK